MSSTDSMLKRFINNEISEQAVYDFVYDKIIAQGKRSMAGDGCVYRSDDGSRCAIGVLCSESELKWIEAEGFNAGFGAGELVKRLYDIEAGVDGLAIPRNTREFLEELQECHDSASGVDFLEKFTAAMERFAEEHELVAA